MAGGREVQVVYDQLRRSRERRACLDARPHELRGRCLHQVVRRGVDDGERPRRGPRWSLWPTSASGIVTTQRDSVVLENCAMVVPRAEDLTGMGGPQPARTTRLHERRAPARRRARARAAAQTPRVCSCVELCTLSPIPARPPHQPLRREPVRVEVIGCRVDEEQCARAATAVRGGQPRLEGRERVVDAATAAVAAQPPCDQRARRARSTACRVTLSSAARSSEGHAPSTPPAASSRPAPSETVSRSACLCRTGVRASDNEHAADTARMRSQPLLHRAQVDASRGAWGRRARPGSRHRRSHLADAATPAAVLEECAEARCATSGSPPWCGSGERRGRSTRARSRTRRVPDDGQARTCSRALATPGVSRSSPAVNTQAEATVDEATASEWSRRSRGLRW